MVSAYANSRALVVILSVLLLSWGTFANFNPALAVADDEKDDKKDDEKDDDEEKRAIIEKIKKQREETRNKNELKEKLQALKEIKKEINDLKKILNEEDKQKLKSLVSDIKDVIKKLNENLDYDKEYKKTLKQELKETKLKIKQEMASHEELSKHKIDSKISALLKSEDPKRDAKKLGLDFKDGKTKVVVTLTNTDAAVLDKLTSLGNINAKNDKQVQLTIKLSDLPKLRSIQGIENIRPPFPAVQFEESLSEGVYFMNADLAQYAGITGKGIKVAVLDLSFTNNQK